MLTRPGESSGRYLKTKRWAPGRAVEMVQVAAGCRRLAEQALAVATNPHPTWRKQSRCHEHRTPPHTAPDGGQHKHRAFEAPPAGDVFSCEDCGRCGLPTGIDRRRSVQAESLAGYAHHAYVPMALHPGDGLIRPFGIGILSRIPILRSESIPYAGLGSGRELVDLSSADSKVRTSRYFVVLATVALADARFTIGNTHFPWTPDGSASDDQREACDRLIGLLGERPVVLCGDFNAPRGGEIFSRLAAHWRDNIPARYTSSIDPNPHRAGRLPLMVDAAFSTDHYRVRNVAMHEGVSDHCAITADIFVRPADGRS